MKNTIPLNKLNRKHHLKTFFLVFSATMLTLILTGLFLLYGPILFFKDTIVTTAMTTLHHQWIATALYDQQTINEVMSRNVVLDPNQNTNPDQITIDTRAKDNATTLPTSPSDGEHIIDGVGFTKLKGATYNGWLVKLYDPSRLYMGVSSKYGTSGEKISTMASKLGAYIGINAGGFIDVDGQGNGGKADAIFIKDGKQLSFCNDSNHNGIHSIIGLDYNNKLLVGRYSQAQLGALHLRDAVEWRPLLIVNGVPTVMEGNGGYGVQPRTVIGQTKNGAILLAIIDGRGITSSTLGASVKDMQELMLEHGAINAANLDGGASSVLVFNNKVVNTPSSGGGERYLPNGFFINHSAGWSDTSSK